MPTAPPSNPAQTTILTIEDEIIVRRSFVHYLTDQGYLVLEADNGVTGLQMYNRHKPSLVLLDLRMPGTDGFECLRQLREQDSSLPIIVISGTGASDDVVRALHLGAWDFILKPIFDMQFLQHSIENALEQVRLRQENIAHQKNLEDKIRQRTLDLNATNQELIKSEQRYRSIYENLQDIYLETSPEGIILELSPSIKQELDYHREELLGSSILKLYADPEQRQELLHKTVTCGQVTDQEIKLQSKNNQIIPFSVNLSAHLNCQGTPDYFSGILRNISQRKQAEDILRDSQQTLEALFNAAPLAIMAIDTERRITLWNQAAESIFGWSVADIIGQPYPLTGPGPENESITNLNLALSGKQLNGLERTRRHRDGHLLEVSISTAPLRDRSETICGVIIIIEDISEKLFLRKKTDRYSRLASLGELAAGVAHEINNPNGLILLNLPTLNDFVMDAVALQQELAAERPALTLGGFKARRAAEAFPQLLGDIEDSSRRIRQIVNDLKDFSSEEQSSDEDFFDLNQSVEKAVRLATNHLKKATTHFSVEPGWQIPAIKGSPQRIEQVIVNLLVNACEALTDRQQSIQLKTGYNQQQQEVYLQLKDSGRGIAADQLPHITDPFFTTRRKEGGTGLGLSVSARIIEAHNGRLEFKSKPAEGTVVNIYFPIESKADTHE